MANFRMLANDNFLKCVFGNLVKRGKKITKDLENKQKIVAFALRKGKVLSIGLNSYVKTHPKQAMYAKKVKQGQRQYLHAEISALLRANDADTLLVLRFNRKGETRPAKPCPICQKAIEDSKVKFVVYS